MERRLLLAISLMIAVAIVPSFFLRNQASPAAGADSTATALDSTAAAAAPAVSPVASPAVAAPMPVTAPPAPPAVAFDTAVLTTETARYTFSTAGAAIEGAEMSEYRSYAAGADESALASLIRPGDRMLAPRLVVNADTVRFDSVPFAVQRGAGLTFSGAAGPLTMRVTYAPVPGHDYLLDVSGSFSGLESRGALMLIGLGSGFANTDADSADNYRHYALSTRTRSVEVHNFRSLDEGERQVVDGPFDWVAVKSKYFIGMLLSPDSTRPQLGGAVLVGEPRENRTAKRADVTVTYPVGPDGAFHYQVYLGPQRRRTLHPLGRDADRASPYGWIFKPIVMPVAGWITGLFLWMHENLKLGYGIVLVLFGVAVRLVLWPLNQKAMKSQVAMMAVQPILQDLQKRYKNDPQKLQQEMMKVYREHQVNPLGGCLPMLLPLPVLLALFFVFANTIELRGAPFLWLPDLALRDPLYIVPLLMGGSMFALSKLSQAGMPPNPQAKMMTIVMPIMMTVLFLNFASGLNLYYAVMNLVSLPQQYIINRARRAEMERRNVGKKS